MVLTELVHLQRKGPLETSTPEGFEWKKIPHVLVLDITGRLCGIEDRRNAEGTVERSLVPAGAKRTKGINANFLWDTAEYVLGTIRDGNAERAASRHAAFKANLCKITQRDPGVKAVLKFLEEIPWSQIKNLREWAEILASNSLLSFRLQSDPVLICARPAVMNSIRRLRWGSKPSEQTRGVCLVTGQQESFEKVHPWIFGVHGTEQGRGKLVSFGQRAFDSYGMGEPRSIGAPISRSAISSYAAALNHLLASQSRQRIQLGDLTVVFWAEKNCGFEKVFARYAGSPWGNECQDPDDWFCTLQRYSSGRDSNTRFFVLGLAGYGSRIAVAFWISERIARIAGAIESNCKGQFLTGTGRGELFVPLAEGLNTIARQIGGNHVPDGLGAAVLRAQILGETYPRAAYSRLLLNVGNRGRVDYASAALIKGHLNRAVADGSNSGAPIPASFDPGVTDPGYLWGRYFAVCELIERRTGSRGSPSLGSRLYKAASVRPALWFESFYQRAKSILLRNPSETSLSALEWHFESVAEAIRSRSWKQENLGEEDQGRFAVGYFQQRQELLPFRMTSGSHQASV